MIASRPIRVLIVDDSAMARKVLTMGLSADPGIEVLGAASNADAAWDLMQQQRPDVITLDVEMPKVDGLTFLRQFLPKMPIPTVMISSLTQKGATITVQAMEAGAVDVISKPSLGLADGLPAIMTDICCRVRAAASARVLLGRTRRALPNALPPVIPHRSQAAILAIGSSTGGVQALSSILPCFPPGSPGIVIVQHMPEGFTGPFASRLDSFCHLSVREARHGDVLESGMVLVAPGGSRHMTVSRHGRNFRVSLIDGDPVCFSRPSVDVLFDSVARAAGANAVGAILTGMGRDGANGLLTMRRAGAHTFAQNEQTSVVYGMPMAARDNGGAEHVLPLEDIPARMLHAAATIGAVRA